MGKSPHLNGTIIDAAVSAGVEATIAHGLDRTPQEAFILGRPTANNVYRGTTAWGATNIYLQADAAVTVRLLVI